jgi:hypothetical protein
MEDSVVTTNKNEQQNEILSARVMFDSPGNAFGVSLRNIWNEISLARILVGKHI